MKRIVDLLRIEPLPVEWMSTKPTTPDEAIFLLTMHAFLGDEKEMEFLEAHTRLSFVRKLMPTVGMWILECWIEDELAERFRELGILLLDDAAELILRGAYDNAVRGDYKLEELVEETKCYWRGLGCPDGIPEIA